MTAALRALLSGIVDYAGLFPPAGLRLDESVRRYAAVRGGPYAWMLGRFVCPASRLGELAALREALAGGRPDPVRLAVIASPAASSAHFRENLARDAAAIVEAVARAEGALAADTFEARLPADLLETRDAGAVSAHCATVRQALHGAGLEGLACFHEPDATEDWRRTIQTVVHGLSAFNAQAGAGPAAGLKLRCGGSDAAAIPTCEQVALTIAACRDHAVPLKFTAGLHHPLRTYDTGMLTHVHGFLNVFAAGVLASALQLEQPDIVGLLEEMDPRNFTFSDEFLTWVEAEATVSEIRWARARRVVSFGSCSFDEPVEGLRRIGLL